MFDSPRRIDSWIDSLKKSEPKKSILQELSQKTV